MRVSFTLRCNSHQLCCFWNLAWRPACPTAATGPWEPHKYNSRHEQDEKLEFLLAWVREYYSREGDLSLVAHQALFDAYPGPKHKLTTLVGQKLIDDSMLLETS